MASSRALVRVASAPRDDDAVWSENYSHVSEKYVGKVGVELQNIVFGTYMVAENMWVPIVINTVDGPVWTCERHPDNKRGGARRFL